MRKSSVLYKYSSSYDKFINLEEEELENKIYDYDLSNH